MGILGLGSAAAEIFLLTAACVMLIVATFKVNSNILLGLTVAILLITTLMVDGGDEASLSYYGLMVNSPLTELLKMGVLLSCVAVLLYSGTYLKNCKMLSGEFLVMVMFAASGMMFMISAAHFLTLYLGLELMSLSLYTMIAMRRDGGRAIEAAMKYFVLGAIASGVLLYGISMIYAATGELGFAEVAAAASQGMEGAPAGALTLGIVFLVAGCAFKLGAAPFHMWLPDVYDGAPTAVTSFIGSAPKIASFALVIRVVIEAGAPLVEDWSAMFAVLAIVSLAVGNIAAIAQVSLKRMLAYSAISHMGFMLIGLASGTEEGYSAGLFYVLTYAIMGIGGFGMLTVLSRPGFEAEMLDDMRGLAKRNGLLASLVMILMLSMAGIPPLVGFYAKLVVWNAAVEAGLVWLAAIAAIFSVIGAFYYLRVIKIMYFDDPAGIENRISISKPYLAIAVINVALVVGIGLLPSGLMEACLRAFGVG